MGHLFVTIAIRGQVAGTGGARRHVRSSPIPSPW